MSNLINTTLLIIGGGPGGYVAAIRAGQLGIPTVLVEGGVLGGTCLNIGCIPSKALIHVAEQFHALQGYAGDSPLGIRAQAPELDLDRSIAWKDAIVKKLTTGIGSLLKKHKVTVVQGWAHIIDGKTVDVDPVVKGKAGAPSASAANTCCWRRGRNPSPCPSCRLAAR